MLIGIDGNEANIAHRVGVNTYAYELLKNLSLLQEEWKNQYKLIVYLKQKPLPDMPEETANFKYKIISSRRMWVLTRLIPRLILNSDRLSVFFSPSHYLPLFTSVPQVCSIMDLGYLEFSTQFPKKVFWQLKWWSAISISISKSIIAISQSTKDDIVRHYPFSKGKIYVTHLAYDSKKFNQYISDDDVRRVRNKYSIVDDYILYLGTLKPSKNIEGLIKAFGMIENRFSKTKLVIAGKKGWMFEPIYKYADKMGLNDKIVFTDFVAEEDKPPLIKGAKVFALPSFWEGFGLDALNAMACGVPVVASNIGSIPEVVGKAGILIDPNSINSIADGISKVLSMNAVEYNGIVKKGLSQVKKFSWEKTARETLTILENAISR
jgi:glycosyltransferase involved in cell wall biosynthesis